MDWWGENAATPSPWKLERDLHAKGVSQALDFARICALGAETVVHRSIWVSERGKENRNSLSFGVAQVVPHPVQDLKRRRDSLHRCHVNL